MTTKQITAEYISFIYSNEFNLKSIIADFRIDIADDALKYISKAILFNLCRIHVSKTAFEGETYLAEYLVWLNDVDLKILDRKVSDDSYEEDDFTQSIKTYFVKDLRCTACNKIFNGGLVMDTVTYWYNENLRREKIFKLQRSGKLKKCPNCGADFRILVIHIFD